MTKSSLYNKKWREKNPEKYREITRRSHKKRWNNLTKRNLILKRARERVARVSIICQILKFTTPCYDCHKRDLPYLMDFDHIKNMGNRSPQSCRDIYELSRELRNVQIVCVRCHRIRTFMRRKIVRQTQQL